MNLTDEEWKVVKEIRKKREEMRKAEQERWKKLIDGHWIVAFGKLKGCVQTGE